MKPPPIPLIPSGLSENCPDVIGKPLLIRCVHGWGWSHRPNGLREAFEDETLAMGEIEIVPEQYVEFTTPRCGILGRITKLPGDYRFKRFLAFIMSDGCDYDFTDNIAPAWRVFVGDGQLDLQSEWFPILSGESTIAGYGTVGRDSEALDRWETSRQTCSEQEQITNKKMPKTTKLYRPVGQRELDLVRDSDFQEWPPRLPEQPIFYPVTNEEYAAQIARDWNTKDPSNGNVGYVTAFEVDSEFLEQFPVKVVGAREHSEHWIPAERLSEFNQHLASKIQVIRKFTPEGEVPLD